MLEDEEEDLVDCCAVCNAQVKLKRCGQCQNEFYCSARHQKQDWHRHRQVCKKATQIALFSAGFETPGPFLLQLPIPASTGKIATLPKRTFAHILDCSVAEVNFKVWNKRLPSDDQMVNACTTKYTQKGISEGPHIVFFLKPGRDLDHNHYLTSNRASEQLEQSSRLQHLSSFTRTQTVWSTYRRELQILQADADPPAISRTVRGLCFPMAGCKPMIIKVQIREKDNSANLDPLGPITLRARVHPEIVRKTRRRGPLPFEYQIYWFSIDKSVWKKSPPSSVINALIFDATDGRVPRDPIGNVIVTKSLLDGPIGMPIQYVDVGMHDVKIVYEWFKELGQSI